MDALSVFIIDGNFGVGYLYLGGSAGVSIVSASNYPFVSGGTFTTTLRPPR